MNEYDDIYAFYSIETANLMFPLIISLGLAGMFVAIPIFQV